MIDLALAHNLVTAYTSLVAVEEVPSSFGPAEFVRLASALPQGGTLDPLRRILGVVLVLCGGSLFVVATRRRAA